MSDSLKQFGRDAITGVDRSWPARLTRAATAAIEPAYAAAMRVRKRAVRRRPAAGPRFGPAGRLRREHHHRRHGQDAGRRLAGRRTGGRPGGGPGGPAPGVRGRRRRQRRVARPAAIPRRRRAGPGQPVPGRRGGGRVAGTPGDGRVPLGRRLPAPAGATATGRRPGERHRAVRVRPRPPPGAAAGTPVRDCGGPTPSSSPGATGRPTRCWTTSSDRSGDATPRSRSTAPTTSHQSLWDPAGGGVRQVIALADHPFFAVAGIGDPESLDRQLRRHGPAYVGHRWFADHHRYTAADVRRTSAPPPGRPPSSPPRRTG